MRTKGRCVTSCLVDMRRYLELLASCRRCFHTIAATNKYCVLYNPTVGQVSDLVLFQDRINVTLISCTSSTTNSLEPGPSRARYFPRDMLLLTTTARERAWRLLKITSPLIGWFDGDSPIPGISPWLAPQSRCTLYIVEVLRTVILQIFGALKFRYRAITERSVSF